MKPITVCGRCGAKGHTGAECRRSRGKACTKCHIQGNFASTYRTNESTRPINQRKQHTSNQLATTPPPLESPSDEKTEIYILNLSNQNGLPTQRVTINKFKLNVFIDSESTLNIINDKVFNSIVPTAKLKPSKATIYPYQATAALSLQGKFIAAVQSQDQRMLTTFHVVKGNGISI